MSGIQYALFIIVSELNNALQTGCYDSPLGYDNVDWFVGEVINFEKNELLLGTLIKII